MATRTRSKAASARTASRTSGSARSRGRKRAQRSAVSKTRSSARSSARSNGNDVARFVREHPLPILGAVLGAAALGALAFVAKRSGLFDGEAGGIADIAEGLDAGETAICDSEDDV